MITVNKLINIFIISHRYLLFFEFFLFYVFIFLVRTLKNYSQHISSI